MKKAVPVRTMGWIYGFVHFSTEVCCFYFLFSRLAFHPLWWSYALVFDALAFLPQSLIGMWIDSAKRDRIGVLGGILLLSALFLPFDIPALILLTLGNAMVHVSGAKHTLCDPQGKITPCSTFVAGGSFGVITGQLLGSLQTPSLLWIPVICMVLSLALCLYVSLIHPMNREVPCTFHVNSNKLSPATIVLLACLSTAIRSYVAYAIPTTWKKDTIHAIYLFCSMGVGKFLGGVLCDRIGYQKTATLSLLISLPLLIFGNRLMSVSLIGIGLFSMTMPVSIGILVSVFPKNSGFAFGLTTIALFLGVAPAFFLRADSLLVNQILVLILGVSAAVSLKTALKRRC